MPVQNEISFLEEKSFTLEATEAFKHKIPFFSKVEKYTTVGLPLYSSNDLLQLVDISVFKALKIYWEDILIKMLKISSRRTKAEL